MQTSVVHGLGGIGKTQLAVEYAWKHLCDYDAVFWVKADSSEALNGGLAALTSLLHLPEAAEGKQAVQTKAILNWLQGHERWLLIADNADTDEAARALNALPRNPSAGSCLPLSVRFGTDSAMTPNTKRMEVFSSATPRPTRLGRNGSPGRWKKPASRLSFKPGISGPEATSS
jgi:hypothetical protein